MGLVWRCECGEEWPESGDRKGYGQASSHGMRLKHRLVGLVDTETGELLVAGRNIARAISLGLVRPKAARKPRAEDQERSTMRARVATLEVPLPASLWALFETARLRFPDAYSDDGQGFGKWLLHCCFGLYLLIPQDLGFDRLLAAALQRLGQGGQEVAERA